MQEVCGGDRLQHALAPQHSAESPRSGSDRSAQSPASPHNWAHWVAIAAGQQHWCALRPTHGNSTAGRGPADDTAIATARALLAVAAATAATGNDSGAVTRPRAGGNGFSRGGARMPRVVDAQRRRFESDDLFQALSRPTEVRYTAVPHAPAAERQQRLLSDCRDGRLPISFTSRGLNLELCVRVMPAASVASTSGAGGAPDDFVVMDEPGSEHVRMSSRLILNGVCVRCTGYVDRRTLVGRAKLEFDQRTAEVEESNVIAEPRSSSSADAEPQASGGSFIPVTR